MDAELVFDRAAREISLLETKIEALREENARYLAAVKEMERMLPSLRMLERDYPGAWIDITSGTGIATLNAYRQALKTALANRSKP